MGVDSNDIALSDSCNFYFSNYQVLNDQYCDQTATVNALDYFTFTDQVCNLFDGRLPNSWLPCFQGYLWAWSAGVCASQNPVGGNRSYDLGQGILAQKAYLNWAYSPFEEVDTWGYGVDSEEVYGYNEFNDGNIC